MTKETKVGLVIGLLFMVGVVYLLQWVGGSTSEPAEQVVDYRAQQRATRVDDLVAKSRTKIPLSAAKKTVLSGDKIKTTVDTTAKKKKDVKDGLGLTRKQPTVKKFVVAPPPKPRFYIVKKGQTLSDVAEAVYGRANRQEWRRIHEANKYKMSNPHVIRPGLKLVIPRLVKSKPTDLKRVLSLGGVRTYTVRRGDVLSTISSNKLGTARRWREIRRLNKDKLPTEDTQLQVGMILKLPAVPRASGIRVPRGHEDIWR